MIEERIECHPINPWHTMLRVSGREPTDVHKMTINAILGRVTFFVAVYKRIIWQKLEALRGNTRELDDILRIERWKTS